MSFTTTTTVTIPSPPTTTVSPDPRAPDAATVIADHPSTPVTRCLQEYNLEDLTLCYPDLDNGLSLTHVPPFSTEQQCDALNLLTHHLASPWLPTTPPESHSPTPDFHTPYCTLTCVCNSSTAIATTTASLNSYTTTPPLPWTRFPDSVLWPDDLWSSSPPASPHPSCTVIPSRSDNPQPSGPLISHRLVSYFKEWMHDWKGRKVPVWITLDGLVCDAEPFHREEEYQALKLQYQAALEVLLLKVKTRMRAHSDPHP